MSASDRSRLPQEAAGLVVVLDLTGRVLAELEDRVAILEDALTAERRERSRAESLLAQLRAYADTEHIDPSESGRPDTRAHEPADPRTEAP